MNRWFAILPLAILLCCVSAGKAASAQKATLLLEHGEHTPWTDMLRRGLADAGKRYGLETETIIMSPGPGQREAFRQAAREHDVVLVASDGLHELLRDNAANFRRVKFGAVDAGIRAPNIMSVTFADEQAAFIAGAVAAADAARKNPDNPVIGWLSGADVPALRSLFNGYREGALVERPGCRVIQALVGSFTDGATAASKMRWLADSGATVVALAAGAGNAEARRIAREAGLEIVELDAEPIDAARAATRPLGTITKAVPRAMDEILASAAGQWRGKEIVIYDLANGGVDFIGRPGIDTRRVEELRREFKSGGIKLHSLRQRTLCDCLD